MATLWIFPSRGQAGNKPDPSWSATILLAFLIQGIHVGSAGSMVTGGQAGGTATGQESKRSLGLRIVNRNTGRPEPGVAIQVLGGAGFGGHTDQDGRFSVPLAEGQVSRLEFGVQKAGFVSLLVAWDNAAGSAPLKIPREYTIKLEPGSTIGAIVRDEQGRPIPGDDVNVSLSSWGRARAGEPRIRVDLSRETKSDKEGRWRCDEVSGQLNNVLLVVTHPEYVAGGRKGNASPLIRSAHDLAELRGQNYVTVLNEGVTVRGLVRDNDGKPIEGAQVSALSSTIQRLTTTTMVLRAR